MSRFDPGDPPEETHASWARSPASVVWHYVVGDAERGVCGAPVAEDSDFADDPPAEMRCVRCTVALAKREADEADEAKAEHAHMLQHLGMTYSHPEVAAIVLEPGGPGRGGHTDYERGYGEGWHDAMQEILRRLILPPQTVPERRR